MSQLFHWRFWRGILMIILGFEPIWKFNNKEGK